MAVQQPVRPVVPEQVVVVQDPQGQTHYLSMGQYYQMCVQYGIEPTVYPMGSSQLQNVIPQQQGLIPSGVPNVPNIPQYVMPVAPRSQVGALPAFTKGVVMSCCIM